MPYDTRLTLDRFCEWSNRYVCHRKVIVSMMDMVMVCTENWTDYWMDDIGKSELYYGQLSIRSYPNH